MSGKKTASTAARRPSPALDSFEKAVKALGKRDYQKALELFDLVIQQHPNERDVAERARTYRRVCERALDTRPAFKPKGFEELMAWGVFLHNRGEHSDAVRFLRQATEQAPGNADARYCLAAAAAQAGDAQASLDALERAIALAPDTRAQARFDVDFEALRDDDRFAMLLQAP
jgi:tetratricopeptide (TPR) repeat protein